MTTNEIPEEFICPITLDIFKDPVICKDGYTYERNEIEKLKISPLTREPFNKSDLVPNRNLKNAIETFLCKKVRRSKLEEFEQEEKRKKQEREERLKQELLKKQKEDRMKQEILKKKREEEIMLERILKMFTSQNEATFNGGFIKHYSNGMNNIRNSSYEYAGIIVNRKYVLTLQLLKDIKYENKDILTKKYDTLLTVYKWIKNYVYGEKLSPLIEFVFSEIIPNLDEMLTSASSKLLSVQHELRDHYHGTSGCYCRSLHYTIQCLQNKVSILNKIKSIKIQTKEFYIVNNDEFCKDFEIDLKLNINPQWVEDEMISWSIIYVWVVNKYKKFNELIDSLLKILKKDGLNVDTPTSCPNYLRYEYNTQSGSNSVACGNILELYKSFVSYKTGRSHICGGQEVDHLQFTDIISDYIQEYYEPLMQLSKLLFEIIDYIQDN